MSPGPRRPRGLRRRPGPRSARRQPAHRGGLVRRGRYHPHDVVHVLDGGRPGPFRSGHHCCQPLLERCALPRGRGPGEPVPLYNTEEEVDLLTATVGESARQGSTMYHELPCVKYEDGTYASVLHPVVDEVPVSVIVNGRTAATMMTSPIMLKELAVGFLLTEGLIRSTAEIEALAERETQVEVITKNPQKLPLLEEERPLGLRRDDLVPRHPPAAQDRVGPRGRARDDHRVGQGPPELPPAPAHRRAPRRGAGPGRRRGRHLRRGHRPAQRPRPGDRVRGPERDRDRGLLRRLHGPDLVRDGPEVPARQDSADRLAGATTSLAVGIAEKGGLAIVGFVRAGRMNIYTHPERVAGAPRLPDAEPTG